MTSDTKVIIGVVVTTVAIIIGGAWYANRTQNPASSATQTVDDTSRLAREDDPVLGSENAAVTVVEFGDFECPACGALHPILKEIKEQFADQPVQFVYRQFPLTQIHDRAQLAAEASLAAQAQGKFWEYHDLLFENQQRLTREDLDRYADQLELNMDQFRQELDDGTYRDAVSDDVADARALGVRGTPTLFINNQQYTGQYSPQALTAAIEAQL